jgi:hypothetical protein
MFFGGQSRKVPLFRVAVVAKRVPAGLSWRTGKRCVSEGGKRNCGSEGGGAGQEGRVRFPHGVS